MPAGTYLKSALNRSDTADLSGNFRKVSIVFTLQKANNNDPFLISDFDPSKVKVKLSGEILGVNVNIQAQLDEICVHSMFYDSTYPSVSMADSTAWEVVQSHSAGAPAIVQLYYTVDFFQVLNLPKVGSMNIQVMAQSGSFTASGSGEISASASYYEIDTLPDIGVTLGAPALTIYPINGGSTTRSINVGNDVVSMFFVNRDKKTNLFADQVLKGANLETSLEKFNPQTLTALRAKRMLAFDVLSMESIRYNNFDLLTLSSPQDGTVEQDADDVNVSLEFNGSNVTDGKCFVSVLQMIKTPASLQYFVAKTAQISGKNMEKVSAIMNGGE